MNNIYKILAACIAAIAVTAACIGFSSELRAADYYVYDEADLLTDEQENELEERLGKLSDATGIDIAVVAAALDGEDMYDCFDRLTEDNNVGGSNGAAAMIYDCNSDAFDFFTDSQADDILEYSDLLDYDSDIADYIAKSDYYSAFDLFVTACGDVSGQSAGVQESVKEENDISDRTYVYDVAGIFTADEKQQLEDKLSEMSLKYKTDVVAVSVETLDGETREAYNERLYQEYNVGGERGGIIMLVATVDRKFDIYAEGKTRECVFYQSKRDALSDSVKSYLGDDDFVGGFFCYADSCEQALEYAENSDAYVTQAEDSTEIANSSEDTYTDGINPKLQAVLVSVVMGLIPAIIALIIMIKGMNTARQQSLAGNYVRNGSYRLMRSKDIFLYTTVTRVKHETQTDNSDSSDSSSSDSGHSGGDF